MIFLMNSNFKINIDPDKSILELKQVIACSLNHANTRFNLINNAHIIDESKNYCSIRDCGINRTIRIVIDYISAPDNIEIVVVIKQNDGQHSKFTYSNITVKIFLFKKKP